MEFFSVLDVLPQLLFFLLFCLSDFLSSFLHFCFWFRNYIRIFIWILSFHFFVRVNFSIIIGNLRFGNVDVFIIHFSKGILKLEILKFSLFFSRFYFFIFLMLFFILLRSKSSWFQFIFHILNSFLSSLFFPSFHFECMLLFVPFSLLSKFIYLL